MPAVACPIDGCDYTTPDYDPVIVAALLQSHSSTHTPPHKPDTAKLQRPTITAGSSSSDWQYFVIR